MILASHQTWLRGLIRKGGSESKARHRTVRRGSTLEELEPRRVLAGLVLWNGLGSADEIANSIVGLGGTYGGGDFVPGVVGDAIVIDQTHDSANYFPKDVLPYERGTIEFDAKLIGFPDDMGDCCQKPSFVTIGDGTSLFLMGYNSNDGAANGGLTGQAGVLNF